ncbi:MAG: hypothetical protein WD941_02875 [Opitutus sp.]
MDNNQAKLILSVYRANGQDARDPFFQEALQQAEADPGLRAWFAEEREQDGQIAAAFASIKAPVEGKAALQTTMGVSRLRPRRWIWPLALAAGLAVLVAVGTRLPSRRQLQLSENDTLAELATNLSEHHLSLGLMSPDLVKLKSWIADQGGPVPGRLPPGLENLAVLGCQTWTTSRGKISLVCFVGEDMKTAHLYVFDQIPEPLGAPGLPGIDAPRLERSGSWSLALWQEAGRGYVLGLPAESDEAPDIAALFRA